MAPNDRDRRPPRENPRPHPNLDLLWAFKNWLLDDANFDGDQYKPVPKRLADNVQNEYAGFSAVIDPSMKGPELTNDLMGYGEQIHDRLVRYAKASKGEAAHRTSRRTKSGRQDLAWPSAENDGDIDAPLHRLPPERGREETASEPKPRAKGSSPRTKHRKKAKRSSKKKTNKKTNKTKKTR